MNNDSKSNETAFSRDAKGKFGFSDGNYVSHKDRK